MRRAHRYQLFHRLRGGAQLTPSGEAFAKTAREIEEHVISLEREVSAANVELGPVRLTISNPLATLWLDELVAFSSDHPQLQLELIVDDDFRNLSRREADVALRRVREPPEHLVGRRLCHVAVLSDRPLWILTHPDLRRSPSVRLVMDLLVSLVESHRDALLAKT